MERLNEADKFLNGREKHILDKYISLSDEGLLGSGGFGIVYKMIQKKTNQPVAVKFSMHTVNTKLIQHQDYVTMVKREGYLHSKLKHEHIIGYIDSFI